jgi:hypothetical protein
LQGDVSIEQKKVKWINTFVGLGKYMPDELKTVWAPVARTWAEYPRVAQESVI